MKNQVPESLMGLNQTPKEDTVDLDDFIITTFCMIDDTMKDILGNRRLRQRGPAPALSDSEALTIEVVGEYLRLHQDKAIFDYFQRHYSHFFPAIRTLHSATFVRQAANLRSVKELVWPGVIVGFSVAPADIHDIAIDPELASGRFGTVLGDRNYWSPRLTEELAAQQINLVAPFKTAKRDPTPRTSAFLARFRYRIETVFSQLVDRYLIKRVGAKDMWHLSSRLLRKALSHTIAFRLNQAQGNPPLQISKLLN